MRHSRNIALWRAIPALVVAFALVATSPAWIAPALAKDGGGDGGGGGGGGGGGSGGGGGGGGSGGGGGGSGGGGGGSGGGGSGGGGGGSSGGSGSSGGGGSGNSGSNSGSGRSGNDGGSSASQNSGDSQRGRSGRGGRNGEDAASTGQHWGNTSADFARQATQGGQVVSLGAVLSVVRAAVPGDVLEVDLRLASTGEWRYELLVLDGTGRYREVVVDARRNRILQMRRR